MLSYQSLLRQCVNSESINFFLKTAHQIRIFLKLLSSVGGGGCAFFLLLLALISSSLSKCRDVAVSLKMTQRVSIASISELINIFERLINSVEMFKFTIDPMYHSSCIGYKAIFLSHQNWFNGKASYFCLG